MAKGWLDNYGKEDNYNDSSVSAPEGFRGDGYSNVGRNYSPAWGGQFQMGGNVYPVNYVPQAAMGGSLPGATGHMYARIGAPSNGKYAKKTLASAQDGKWLDKWKEDHPSIKSIKEQKGKETKTVENDNTAVKKTERPELTKKEYNKGNYIVKNRGNYAITKNNKILVPVEREGQVKQYVNYGELEKGKKLSSDEIAKIQNYKKALDTEDLGALRRPLTYLSDPEKMLGDIGVPGMETSEAERLYFAQRDNHPKNSDMSTSDKMYDSFKYGLGKTPGAALNLGLAILGNPGASPARVVAEALNPFPTPLPARGIKINPSDDLVRLAKQTDNVDDTYSMLREPMNPYAPTSNVSNYFTNPTENTPITLKDRFKSMFGGKEIMKPSNKVSKEELDNIVNRELDYVKSDEYLSNRIKNTGEKIEDVKKEINSYEDYLKSAQINIDESLNGGGSYYRPSNSIIVGAKDRSTDYVKGVVQHETNHLLSPTSMNERAYKNFPTIEFEPNFSTGSKKYNMRPEEQQVRFNKIKTYMEDTYNKKRGSEFSDEDISTLLGENDFNSIRDNQYYQDGSDFIKDIVKSNPSNYKTLLKEGLNKSWIGVPGAIGLGAASQMEQKRDGGVIKDDMGQWAHPGEITEINSNDITMEGVPYDVLGISDTGDTKLMKPGKNYKFKGKKVTEYPMAKNGVNQADENSLVKLDQLTNFTNYNTKQPGGWLDEY